MDKDKIITAIDGTKYNLDDLSSFVFIDGIYKLTFKDGRFCLCEKEDIKNKIMKETNND